MADELKGFIAAFGVFDQEETQAVIFLSCEVD